MAWQNSHPSRSTSSRKVSPSSAMSRTSWTVTSVMVNSERFVVHALRSRTGTQSSASSSFPGFIPSSLYRKDVSKVRTVLFKSSCLCFRQGFICS